MTSNGICDQPSGKTGAQLSCGQLRAALQAALVEALRFDRKVLVEEFIDGHEVEVASIGHLSEGDKCVLVLRPESAQLAEQGVLPCKVTLSRFMGNYQNYQVMVGDTLVKITDFNPKNHKIFEVGDEAYVKFGKEDVHVL